MKFWIIKTRQSISDISEWSRKGPTHQWFGRRLPRNWSRGDLLFIWAAAPRLKVFRVAKLAVPDDGEEAGDSLFRIRYRHNNPETAKPPRFGAGRTIRYSIRKRTLSNRSKESSWHSQWVFVFGACV